MSDSSCWFLFGVVIIVQFPDFLFVIVAFLIVVWFIYACYRLTDEGKFENTEEGERLAQSVSSSEYIMNQYKQVVDELKKYPKLMNIKAFKQQFEDYEKSCEEYKKAKKEYDDAFFAWKNRK